MARKSLYDDATYEECRARIGHLRDDSAPSWGTMTASQMVAHCAEVQEVANGKELVGTPWFIKLIAPLIHRSVMNDKPYPHGLRTHPQYRQTTERVLDAERSRLLAIPPFAPSVARRSVRSASAVRSDEGRRKGMGFVQAPGSSSQAVRRLSDLRDSEREREPTRSRELT